MIFLDPNGRPVSFDSFGGRPTLLVFLRHLV